MPDNGCTKCVIDTSMSVLAARFYQGVLGDMKSDGNANIKPRHVRAPDFYIGVVDTVVSPFSDKLWHAKLSEEQRARLLTQLQEECYRADYLNAWGMVDEPMIEQLQGWTIQLFAWAKQNQVFFTEMMAEVFPPN